VRTAAGTHGRPGGGPLRPRRPDRRHARPGQPHRRPVERPQVLREAGQPDQPPQDERPRGGHRPGRRRRGGDAGRGRLPRQVVLLPGQPPARALDRGAGRHQRRQELPLRRRLGAPAVLRHRQGRRLPLARVERAPPGRGQRQHHRPVRRAGRALRPRVLGPARHPLVRRHAGLAHLLRARADRPAAAAGRLPGARASGARRHRRGPPAHRDARPHRRGREGARDRHAQPVHRGARHAPRRRRDPVLGRLRQRLLPVDERQGLQRHGDLAGAQAGRAVRQPLLHPDPPDLHPGQRRLPVEADPDERVAAQRRP
ncbi:MAG: Succinate dehydrogenase flavoprotein subunit, partial [uncultured Actinomycetospora sp.]